MLDNHGKVAAACIAFYTPALALTGLLTFRNFRTNIGWAYLFGFSLIRIVFGILTIVTEESSKPNIGIIVTVSILASVGLSILLLATMGFLRTISSIGFEDKPTLLRLLKRTELLFTAAIALSIAGGSLRSPTNTASTQNKGRAMVRAAIVILAATFALLVAFTAYFWRYRVRLTRTRANLLKAFALAIPFLIVRLVYSLLGAFSNSLTSKWSPVYGSWVAFLVMGLLMEYIVLVIYVVAGMAIPYSKDADMQNGRV